MPLIVKLVAECDVCGAQADTREASPLHLLPGAPLAIPPAPIAGWEMPRTAEGALATPVRCPSHPSREA